MAMIQQENRTMREFFTNDFAQSFPRSFQALQKMALAGSKAYNNAGKKSWLGRDKGAESYAEFVASVQILGSYLSSEGYFTQNGLGDSTWAATCEVVRAFFVAYPNWQDAEGAWAYFESRATDG